MKFEDILALAKQGYKPADIKELLSIQTPDENVSRETIQEVPETVQEENEPETVQEESEPEPDYKTMFEETQKKLQQVQKDNINQNIKGHVDTKTDSELFSDLMRSFM